MNAAATARARWMTVTVVAAAVKGHAPPYVDGVVAAAGETADDDMIAIAWASLIVVVVVEVVVSASCLKQKDSDWNSHAVDSHSH